MQHEGFEPTVTNRLGRGLLARKFVSSILQSKRVYATLAGILVSALAASGMDEALALSIVATLASWIVSDSVRPTDNVFASRRFWAVVASVAAAAAAKYGFAVDPEVLIGIILPVVSWILGDGIRETLSGNSKAIQLRMKR